MAAGLRRPLAKQVRASAPRVNDAWGLLLLHRETAIAGVRRRLGPSLDAEDVVDEAIMRLVTRAHIQATGAAQLMIRTACGIAIDWQRRRDSEARALVHCLPLAGDSADEVVIDRDEAGRLHGRLDYLSPCERASVIGAALGLEPKETAHLLGVSARSMHLALSRARRTLRQAD